MNETVRQYQAGEIHWSRLTLAEKEWLHRQADMSEIPPVTDLKHIPKDATCQEASAMSGHRYIACGRPAVAIISADHRAYYECFDCAMHSLRNRGLAIIYAKDPVLQGLMKAGKVRVVDKPDTRGQSSVGESSVIQTRLPER